MENADKKNVIDQMRTELEEIEEQLRKSGREFQGLYEQKKHRFVTVLQDYAQLLEKSGSEKAKQAKEKITDMLDLLESDYDVNYVDYSDEPHKISQAFEKLEDKLKELREEVSETGQRIEADVQHGIDRFKMELDIQKAHFRGTSERAKNDFDLWKEKRLQDIDEMKHKLEQRREEAGSKFGSFSEEIAESFSHLQKAFRKLW
jgi:methyl-accepting chemotaxis protein